MRRVCAVLLLALCTCVGLSQSDQDATYTSLIRFYTTDPRLTTPLTNYLPASETVPSPLKFFGHIVGEPGLCWNNEEIDSYFYALAKASPRVRVEDMGTSPLGKKMILVLVSSEENFKKVAEYKKLNALLSDPRKLVDYEGDGNLKGADEKATQIIQKTVPFYYFTAGVHAYETAPTQASMEFVYRLAVDDSAFVRDIRSNSVVMFTPVMDPDTFDQAALSNLLLHQHKKLQMFTYSDEFVGHDINRDNIDLVLRMSKNLTSKFYEYHPLVLNDLHQAMPHLFISPGTGPFNPLIDQSELDDELALAKDAVGTMTAQGVPGVYTNALYDGYGISFGSYVATCHNAIGRVFEVDGDIDTSILHAGDYDSGFTHIVNNSNPPLPSVLWSYRDSMNLDISAMLLGAHYVAAHKAEMLENYYERGKNSMLLAWNGGPAAFVIPAQTDQPLLREHFLDLLRRQRIEIAQLTAPAQTRDGSFAAGSYVIRLDQPYGRCADLLFQRQQYPVGARGPYDQVGWTIDLDYNIHVDRCNDPAILSAPMQPVSDSEQFTASSPIKTKYLAVAPSLDPFLNVLAWRDVKGILVAEDSFKAGETDFPAGTYIIPGDVVNDRGLSALVSSQNLAVKASLTSLPSAQCHQLSRPRIAFLHASNSVDGWERVALRTLDIPYDYIDVDEWAKSKKQYDVVLITHLDWNTFKDDLPPNANALAKRRMALRMQAISDLLQRGGLAICFDQSGIALSSVGLAPALQEDAMHDDCTDSILGVERSNSTSPVQYGYGDRFAVPETTSFAIMPKDARNPGYQTILRYAPMDKVMLSGGWVDMRVNPPADESGFVKTFYGGELAGTPAILQAKVDKGTVLVFGFDPFFRDQAVGSWLLMTNALGNWAHLNSDLAGASSN